MEKLIRKAIPVISDHPYPLMDHNPETPPKQQGRGGMGRGGRSSGDFAPRGDRASAPRAGFAPRNGGDSRPSRDGSVSKSPRDENRNERSPRRDDAPRPPRDDSRTPNAPQNDRIPRDAGTFRVGVMSDESSGERRKPPAKPGFRKPENGNGGGFGRSNAPSRNPGSRRK